jgi:hypothetical protein
VYVLTRILAWCGFSFVSISPLSPNIFIFGCHFTKHHVSRDLFPAGDIGSEYRTNN